MNSSLTDLLASLLFLVAQSTLPAVLPTQKVQLENLRPQVAATATQSDQGGKVRTGRKRVSHTPYYDFGRRHTRAKD
ncbi:hypothetical protein C7S18_14100 [Ahniella affigens]|uniref:Uncharacterized protein n=1 Tax=Ahniella affigens TaxID=2021234 RepID=A0A2P1PTT9_9GAMM|nr:hypothetical protein [Ahniella affigens]AVP98255.1 hypothetical protein C7S18_14100 [Ahniella affigens]